MFDRTYKFIGGITKMKNKNELLFKAEKGDIGSQYDLWDLYFSEDNMEEAVYWLEKAATNNNTDSNTIKIKTKAQGNLGFYHLSTGNTTKGIKLMEEAAENGATGALRNLMFLSSLDQLPGDNCENFFKWAGKLANEHNDYVAMITLGTVYCGNPKHPIINGLGINEDYFNPKKGFELIEDGIELANKDKENNRLIHTDYFHIAHAYHHDIRPEGKRIKYENDGIKACKLKLSYATTALELAQKDDEFDPEMLNAFILFKNAAEKECKEREKFMGV
jgi:TPR repeat protein